MDARVDASIPSSFPRALASTTLIIRNAGSESRWLHSAEVEVFESGVQPDADKTLSTNSIAAVTFTHAVGSAVSGMDDSIVLTDGFLRKERAGTFSLSSGVGNALHFAVSDGVLVGVVRVWQRPSCCWERLANLEIEYEGVVQQVPDQAAPNFAQANFGLELFSWSATTFLTETCPSGCGVGRGAIILTRAVSCMGDHGTSVGSEKCQMSSGATPASIFECPHTGCCNIGPQVLYVAGNGSDTNSSVVRLVQSYPTSQFL